MTPELNFVRQQGLRDATSQTCGYQYRALMWQPRLIGVIVLVAVVFQARLVFLGLGALLWWNAALPGLSLFDALYNLLVAGPKGLPGLGPAPAPRRFAQAIAGAFAMAIGLALATGRPALAWLFEGFLIAAVAALIFGRFCLGSYLYHLSTGQAEYANATLPWVGDE
jgi:uncharacterized protein DUF4395